MTTTAPNTSSLADHQLSSLQCHMNSAEQIERARMAGGIRKKERAGFPRLHYAYQVRHPFFATLRSKQVVIIIESVQEQFFGQGYNGNIEMHRKITWCQEKRVRSSGQLFRAC